MPWQIFDMHNTVVLLTWKINYESLLNQFITLQGYSNPAFLLYLQILYYIIVQKYYVVTNKLRRVNILYNRYTQPVASWAATTYVIIWYLPSLIHNSTYDDSCGKSWIANVMKQLLSTDSKYMSWSNCWAHMPTRYDDTKAAKFGIDKQPEATGEFVAKMNKLNLCDWTMRMLEAKILFMLLSRKQTFFPHKICIYCFLFGWTKHHSNVEYSYGMI